MSTVIPFPGTELAIIQKVRVAHVSDNQIFGTVGARTVSEFWKLARQGNIHSSGKITMRPHPSSGKGPIEECGFEFSQIESDDGEPPFHFRLEVGNGHRASTIELGLDSGIRGFDLSSVCPRCKRTEDSRWGWSLRYVESRGWGCSETCFGLQWLEDCEPASAYFRTLERFESNVIRRARWRDTFEVFQMNQTHFFAKRPQLAAAFPQVFYVHKNGFHKAIGHFIADPRQLPVIESKHVQVSL